MIVIALSILTYVVVFYLVLATGNYVLDWWEESHG